MKISHKLHVRVDETQFLLYDGLQPKMRAGIINEHECTAFHGSFIAPLMMC